MLKVRRQNSVSEKGFDLPGTAPGSTPPSPRSWRARSTKVEQDAKREPEKVQTRRSDVQRFFPWRGPARRRPRGVSPPAA